MSLPELLRKIAALGQLCLSHSGFGVPLLPGWCWGTRLPPGHPSALQPAGTLRVAVEVGTVHHGSERILKVQWPGLPLSNELIERAGGRRKRSSWVWRVPEPASFREGSIWDIK